VETITCSQCRKTFTLDIHRILGGTPKETAPAEVKPAPRKIKVAEGACPKCGAPFRLPLGSLPEKPAVDLNCKSCRAKFKVNLASLGKP